MSLPYFPLYPSDFEAKTSHLTIEEDGAYNRLLRLMWMTPGCSLPNDHEWIARRMRVNAETYERVVRPILSEFFSVKRGRIVNKKLSEIARETAVAHSKRVKAGSAGGAAKARKEKDNVSSNAKAMLKQPEPEPEPEPTVEEETYVSSPHPANDLSHAVTRYNDAAAKAGWPQVQKLTPARSKQLRARLKECGGTEGWEQVLLRAFDSDFLCGRSAKAWTGFSFDWLVKQANFTKLMEGNYDNRSSRFDDFPHPGRAANAPHDDWKLRAIARAAGSFETPGWDRGDG